MKEELLAQIKTLPGYKIARSHFRLGSKIHLSDFYYAKRFFQNHFFASRFAFMLAKEILSDLENNDIKAIRKEGLFLVGYGLYSELLLSLVEKFLRRSPLLAKTYVQHDLVEDSQNLDMIKRTVPSGCCVIVVPIASTFSTSIKIEQTLLRKAKEKDKKVRIFSPHFNLLHIANNDSEEQRRELEEEFGWKHIINNKKEIQVKAFFDKDSIERKQRYFLNLPSRWQKIERCEDCFPTNSDTGIEEPLREKPLFETDRASVTPTIIFDSPKGRPIDDDDKKRKCELKRDMIRYGHHTRNHHHFIYSIYTELFLNANRKRVRDWLRLLKKAKSFQTRFPISDHVVLISSCHYSNATFLNLVNEELFSSSANIIHYDLNTDYIQNLNLLYGLELYRADKIVFVDDSLKTGKTFSKIYEFVSFTLFNRAGNSPTPYKGKASGISECIFLLNKAQPITAHVVDEKLKAHTDLKDEKLIYAFTHLHLFTNLSYDDAATLIQEEKRYKALVEDSFLDSLKVHFLKQQQKLEIKPNSVSGQQKERHLLMLDACHRLYDFFSSQTTTADDFSNFRGFSQALYEVSTSPIEYKHTESYTSKLFSDKEAALLKVLTQSPFTHFAPLRRKVFEWVLQMLDNQLTEVAQLIKIGNFDFWNFIDLKFLLRRAGLLNSNFVISKRILQGISCLYSKNGLPTLEDYHHQKEKGHAAESQDDKGVKNLFTEKSVQETGRKVEQEKLQNIRDFHVFYVAQVKELLRLNEARSIQLEMLLHTLESDAPGYKQIIRILRMENSIVVQKFYEFLRKQIDWEALYPTVSEKGEIDESTAKIKKFLEKEAICLHHRYRNLEQFFKATKRDITPYEDATFIDYLWVCLFLASDRNREDPSLAKRTQSLFSKLKEILKYANEMEKVAGIGAFMIVKGSAKSYFIAYDKNYEGMPEFNPSDWDASEDILLRNFLNGIVDDSGTYYKSIMELKRDESANDVEENVNEWRDLYATKASKEDEKLTLKFLPSLINRIILVRLSRRISVEKENAQGIIGFYFNSSSPDTTSANYVQYLILLRNSLSDYVEKHYQTNEFRELFIAENARRLALLSGHGKHMLLKLSQEHPEFSPIALNLERLQMIIQADETVSDHSEKSELNKTFRNFYDVEGHETITDSYAVKLKDMVEKIFALQEIENTVPCTIKVISTNGPFSFAFNEQLLDLICFEIFLNAKKNRWIVLEGEDDPAPIQKNDIKISLECKLKNGERKLTVEITNTGPSVDPGDIRRLNTRNNLYSKRNEVISGTALIKTLIRRILGGDCIFSTESISKSHFLSTFTVRLVLPEMKNRTNGEHSSY